MKQSSFSSAVLLLRSPFIVRTSSVIVIEMSSGFTPAIGATIAISSGVWKTSTES